MTAKLITRLALAIAGASLIVSGTVYLVDAGWGGLVLVVGPLWASAITGGVLALFGAIALLVARKRKQATPPPPPQGAIISAFFEGLRAGRATAGRRG